MEVGSLTKESVKALIDKQTELASSKDVADEFSWDHEKLIGILKSLEADEQVTNDGTKTEGWKLTGSGDAALAQGSPEAQVFEFVKGNGPCTNVDVEKALGKDVAKVGFGTAMKLDWVQVDKATKSASCKATSVTDEVKVDLGNLASLDKLKLDALKKRKLITATSLTTYRTKQTSKFTLATTKKAAEITAEMIQKGTWSDMEFKALNLKNVSGAIPPGGHLHPLLKVRTEMRQIMLLMGFEEMSTNQWVESSFWNFDTLYQPQQHPARDAHDTFFVGEPARAQNLPMDYLDRVRAMHEVGGQGSTGWKYDWSEDEARKNLLRTHTTACSARHLYRVAQECMKTGVFRPRKFFSIDRVFRNETLDATHLAEFHQVEGFVADRNIGLGQLIGILREYFRRQGITKIRFKPAYNPYTEPSMEIFGYHPTLKKWVELGNSGVFRPEMILPMGFPEDVSVIAWGVALERPVMIKYDVANIRELFGIKQDVAVTRVSPLAWIRSAKEGEEET